MKISRLLLLAALAAASLPLAAGSASATPVTVDYNFDISLSAGGPATAWTGSVALTFDPAQSVATGSPVDSFSSNLTGYTGFSFGSYGASSLVVGNYTSSGVYAVTGSTNTAFFQFSIASGYLHPSFESAAVESAAGYGDFSSTGVVTVGTIAPVPEPSAAVILGSGLLALGFLYRRRVAGGRRARSVSRPF